MRLYALNKAVRDETHSLRWSTTVVLTIYVTWLRASSLCSAHQAKTRHVQLLGNPPPEKALFSSELLFLVAFCVLILGLNAATGGCFQPIYYLQPPWKAGCTRGWQWLVPASYRVKTTESQPLLDQWFEVTVTAQHFTVESVQLTKLWISTWKPHTSMWFKRTLVTRFIQISCHWKGHCWQPTITLQSALICTFPRTTRYTALYC